MKICFIADGRATHTQRWIEYFSKNNDVHLITYDPMPNQIERVTEHVINGPFKNLYLNFWPRQIKIQKLIKKINPDLIHAHFIAKYGFHLPSGNKYPTIVSAWGSDILILPQKSRLIYFYTKKILNRADLVYAVSYDICNHIIDDFGIEEKKVCYLPFGVDTSVFHPRSIDKSFTNTHVNIFSNRGFDLVYDMDTLVKGFEQAYSQNNDLRLTLKGEGPLKKDIIGLVEKNGLKDVVKFQGRTGYSEVSLDYRKYDLFVNTSISDGTPVTLLEAMSSGLTVISTNVGGIPEWVNDGVNGVLIPPKRPDILAEKILELASDSDLRGKISTNARTTVVERADWWKLMKKVEEDYRELVEIHNTRS